ncbi:MAG: pirin family protein [Deltaproteobacteria bacterium]|nr:pirin family protein [Deltaproteobacteria bacterium]
MSVLRKPRRVIRSQPVIEGAGVHLNRAFGHSEAPGFDPFLLLDDFRSSRPDRYLKGFPWHPHRGMETITYMLEGIVEHGDSMGNSGTIGPGDVQWMTAGSGIVHQEMPRGNAAGKMGGFQLWANLPATHKMMAPRYQEIPAHRIPEVFLDDGICVRVVCGQVGDVTGPVTDIVIDPQYLDVSMPPHTRFSHFVTPGYTVFAYVVEGRGGFAETVAAPPQENGSVVVFEDGDRIAATTADDAFRFLLISGKPIGEPVAWRGPIVMNTREELELAFREYRDGSFIKHGAGSPR